MNVSSPDSRRESGALRAHSPSIGVVLPTRDRAALLADSLASLAAQTLAPGEFEVVVVDDGSSDDTAQVCERFSEQLALVYVRTEGEGIAKAKNLGVEAASAPIVLFFDDDDVADPELLREHLAAHAEHPADNVAVLGWTGWAPHLEVTELMRHVTDVGQFLFAYGGLEDGAVLDHTYFWGGRSSAKRALLLEHGLFDAGFHFGCEDIELGYRLAQRGFSVVFRRSAVSWMNRPVGFDDFLRRCERQGLAQAHFATLHPDPAVQRYCQVERVEELWARCASAFEAQAARIRELEVAPALDPAALEELHRLYAWTFTAAKLKGIAEARRTQGAKRKRILVADPFLPAHDRASGSRRLFEVLRLLAAQGHEIAFFSRYRRPDDERYARELAELGIEVHAGLAPGSPELGSLLSSRRYDAVMLSFWYLAEEVLDDVRRFAPGASVLVDTVDVHWVRERREAELHGDGALLARAEQTKERELAVYRRADTLVAVTEDDRQALLAELPGAAVHVVPNVHEPGPTAPGPDGRQGLLFVGNFRHTPNVDAVRFLCAEVFPRVREELPGATLTIVGDAAPPEVLALAGPDVTVTGWVPSVEPYLRSARVSVAPLRYGAGLKGKIGEALAAGLPVVTTSVGAEGMGLEDGAAALVADDPAAFAAAIVRLHADDELWRALSTAGPALVSERYGRGAVAPLVERLVSDDVLSAAREPLTSIVILVKDELECTRACLDSIAAHTPEPHEVIVVDNGSSEETAGYLREYAAERPNARLVRNESNRGFAGGNNQGLALTRGDTVLLLNNDTVVTPGWLSRMLGVLDRHPETGLVGPMSNAVSGPQLVADADYEAAELEAYAARFAAEHPEQSKGVNRLVGFCLLARWDVVQEVGGLDESFGPGNFEDDDFCLRAAQAGYGARIAGDAFVHHEQSRTFKSLGIQYGASMQANWHLFEAKWGAELVGDDGYVIPDGESRVQPRIPLSDLGATHQPSPDGVCWTEVSAQSSALTGRALVDVTLQAATAALAAGRVEELPRLLEETGAWQDQQRAVQARRQLVELAFGASHSLPPARWLELYASTASVLLRALETSPSEPVLLNYAGVLLYELAELGGAEALFQTAARLDPDLEHVRANLRAVRERRKSAGAPRLDPGVRARARALGTAARRLAAGATPARGLTVSLCMIVKDEEEMLPGCLEAARDFVDELIVVDTGSSDRTVEIAREAGAKVVHFPWNGSFSDARNASLEEATGDWILYLDADEHLVPDDAPAFRALLGRTWREAFYLVETNYTGGDESGSAVNHLAMRLFRNRPEYRFVGRIHEQKTQSMPTYLPERFEASTVRVRHYGYLKSRVTAKDKSRRNIELLEAEARETPTPFNAFNLGSEYVALGEREQARTHFERAWEGLRANGSWHEVPYAPMLVSRLVAVRRELGDVAAARALVREALTVLPGFTDLVLQDALCARDAGHLTEAALLVDRCLELGDAPPKYSPTVGAGTYLALCLLAELRPERAEELYRRSLAEHPSYVAPVLPLAAAMLSRGASADETAAAVPTDKPSTALLLATALYEAGQSEPAESWFRSVLERQPANGAARIGLVESLLSQKRYVESAAEAAAVEEGSQVVLVAAASELFALAAAGDASGLQAALDRAQRSGLSNPELELYGAWAAVLEGGAAPDRLPAAAAPTAATCLEALLRVQDIDAFATLLPLYETVAVSPRERRETLARMYLRRGFLASAADEWIAVVDESPDPRALVGLAQVALAQELPEDALEFARAAVELEPHDGEARQFHETLERRLAA